VRAEGDGSQRIRLSGGHAQILLGSPAPIEGVQLTRLVPAPARMEVFHFPRPRAVHRMWWTRDPIYLYQIDLNAPDAGGFSFQLHPIAKMAP
jgi:hypothetical protein